MVNKLQLRPYQTEIAQKANDLLHKYNIAYLAMECRCGKTLTALETVRLYGAKNVLFITKNKAIGSVISDYKYYSNEFMLDVLNYQSLHKVNGKYDIILCDEIHSISGYPKQSKWATQLKAICKGIPIVYLSATPTAESFSQIYHQLWISSFSPFIEKTFYKWANIYVNKKTRLINGFNVNDYSDAKQNLIEEKTKHLFLTYTQKQSGFDISIREEILYCDMSDFQKKLIKTLINDKCFQGKNDTIIADTAVKLQNKIHQICSGTIILDSGKKFIISTIKAEFIKEEFKSKKIAIFYKFVAEFEALKKIFSNWTNDNELFQQNNNLVYLGQFVSSREGIRLDTADCIIFYNIDFSALSYLQSKDRIISKERTEEAVLYWIFSRGGIEEKIYKAVKLKKNYTNYYFKKDFLC